jgi:hypothetical protein
VRHGGCNSLLEGGEDHLKELLALQVDAVVGGKALERLNLTDVLVEG